MKYQSSHVGFDHFQTLLVQTHLARKRRQKRTQSVNDRGAAESWVNFLCNRRSPNNVAPLEHEWRITRFPQIKRRSQPIVARADNDDALRFARHQFFHSRRIFLAAFSPEAPMMPPPGCVAEPHI